MADPAANLHALIQSHRSHLQEEWAKVLRKSGFQRSGQIKDEDLRTQIDRFVEELVPATAAGTDSLEGAQWSGIKEMLSEFSRTRALQGFSPSETARFVFALKEPLFGLLRSTFGRDSEKLGAETWAVTRLLDSLGLYTTEVFQKNREAVIQRQQRELLELSTPVVQLWDRILALPLIGTLDSERTQIVMERLLQAIVDNSAEIAIIDISGVPTVDTLVAQHLIKTVSAARLMGADCIISGIRPQIAQTIVHLGLDLDVVSKANMADAFALALRRTGQSIASASSAARA
jgi:rsbT co-antagonist protein RsbR